MVSRSFLEGEGGGERWGRKRGKDKEEPIVERRGSSVCGRLVPDWSSVKGTDKNWPLYI